jgi:NADPH:quinone reductase-like Zn-dependent oxidoreductase
MVRSLGADRVIDYTQQDFTQDQETYDVIVNVVDKLDRSKGKRRLNPGGVYLNIVKDSGSASGVKTEDLTFLTRLVEDGRLRAVIDRCYPLEQIVEAHRYVEQGHKKGHVVITVAPSGIGER